METRNNLSTAVGATLLLSVIASWYVALFVAPTDAIQGDVYRIIYLHLPVAISAFFSAFVLFLFSLAVLIRPHSNGSLWAQASAEVGLLLTCLTLATGMLWGKPTWGVYWTWDARLTTTLLLAIMYAGYLLLNAAMESGRARDKACAAVGILIFADVPIIYKSVTWWRTLHQPPSILRPGGESTMDPEMRSIVLLCLVCLLLLSSWMITHRTKNLKIRRDLEKRLIATLT